MRPLDLTVIVLYLVAMPVLGLVFGGRQRTSQDYFVGSRQLPWWAVCFSVVATETSTLTVISVPTLAYLGSFTYLQLAIGYLIGRIVVAFVLLPRYYAGNLVSAYAFLGQRFGGAMQGTASVTFLITRLLAEGLRLFAAAIPVKVVLDSVRVPTEYWQIVVVLSLLTIVYTYLGGIRAVVWVDAIQMLIYLSGAIFAAAALLGRLPTGWFETALVHGKFKLFDFGSSIVTQQYAFVTAVVGGAVFAMGSHGADQLMVQRLLSCKNLRDGQRALIGSGVVVLLQFALFTFLGTMLWGFYRGAKPSALGMASKDELFPRFVVEHLPPGVSGLLIAGILAAAMGTLASALNSLSSSTVDDLHQRVGRDRLDDASVLKLGKLWTLVWAGVLVVFASMFTTTNNPIVEVGLSIAGYTYGALLGAFFLGLWVKRARQADAVIAFLVTLLVVLYLVFGVTFPNGAGGQSPLAFPWYTPAGVLVTLLVGGLLSLRHPKRTAEESTVEKTRAG